MARSVFCVLSLFALAPAVFADGVDPDTTRSTMSIVDLINVPTISGVQVSPDGSQILYRRTDADWDENKTISHVWRVNADGTAAVQMTNGENGESAAIWAPDGSTIAFTARRGDDDHGQIYLMPNDGGEAIRLTEHATAPNALSWSLDGRFIYFRAADDDTEEEKAREKIDDNVFKFDENKKNQHIWRVDVESSETEKLTVGEFHVGGYNLSHDGSLIAYLRAPSPLLDDGPAAEVWVMAPDDTTGGRQVTDNPIGESGIRISLDNSKLLYHANTNDTADDYYYNDRLFVVDLETGQNECVVCGGDFDVNAANWAPSGTEIYFRANTGIRWSLYEVSLADKQVESVVVGDHAIFQWDFEPQAQAHAFTLQTPTNPGEIWIARADDAGAPSRRVTDIFDYIEEEFLLPEVEVVRWEGEDGVEVEGIVHLPMDHVEGERYPLVVQTHGGPASSDLLRFPRSVNYETVLTSMGYVVFKPNYRGSTGYGDDFLRDMVGNYFNEAHNDVMTGVDHLIERGLVDGDRMAKMGWSAGGHMTNKIITYTDRFKAASSGAGAINWISMYGQSDVRVYRTPWFGGNPWDEGAPIDQFVADSPLFDVHKVTTPTLVLVGENDARVPMPQSVELFRALRSQGVPTHLYVAPKQGHGWRELQQRLFKANVELDWYERWVTERDYEWEKSPVHEKDEANSE